MTTELRSSPRRCMKYDERDMAFAQVAQPRAANVSLRPYQRDLLQQVQTALAADTKARVMMQLPTGGGKTIIAGALLTDWLTAGARRFG